MSDFPLSQRALGVVLVRMDSLSEERGARLAGDTMRTIDEAIRTGGSVTFSGDTLAWVAMTLAVSFWESQSQLAALRDLMRGGG